MKCPICNNYASVLGQVTFDRNNAKVPESNLTLMHYHKCDDCSLVFCKEMLDWTVEQLGTLVYNDEYIKYDPDYLDLRPRNYARFFMDQFPTYEARTVKHLDYGSGLGLMAKELSKYGWNSSSYDPYTSPAKPTTKFKLITAIEVFEHSRDIDATIKDIKSMLDSDGVVIFSTQLVPKDVTIDWWYIGARNGHIGMLSAASLKILAIRNEMYFSSLNEGIHVLQSHRGNLQKALGVKYNGR